MDYVGGLVLILSSSLGLYLLAAALKYFNKLWWRPHRIQKAMAAQGIRGPPYKIFHGNSKEIFAMQLEAMSRPKGLSHDIFSQVQPHLHLWVKQYGKNFLTWLGTRPQLVVTEPELCKEILSNRDNAYPKAEVEPFMYKILGDGLGTSSGEKWSRVRKIANHAFHGESLKGLTGTVIEGTELMLERWKNHEGKEMEVFEEFRLLTSEAISRAAFGSSFKEGEKIFEMLDKLAFLSFRNVYKPRPPILRMLYKTSDDIESDKLWKGVRDSVLQMVKNREKQAMNGAEDGFGNDFLGNLVKSMHDVNEKVKIKAEDLVDECKTVYFAGQETVNSSLAWTVFLMALHPDWQEEARKEVLQIFGKQNPNVDGLAKLKTLGMIVNEALRLYPPIVIIERKAGKDVKLGNFVVPAEVELIVSSLAVQHEPEFWGPDALVFKPERFSEGVLKATNNSLGKFLPFGLGPRNCVGSSFAYNEIKIVLSMILQRYSFTLSPAYVHSPFRAVTVRPQHGVQVLLQAL